jgi:mannose-6-phosphate isomerase-like protein (cupin superfamily)
MHFSHIKPTDSDYRVDGLRNFFAYRDLGIEDATAGRMIVQLVKANALPGIGTGWHYHEADYHVVYMLSGWAKFMYEDVVTLVQAGDCVHQNPGIRHYLFDYSPDMEFLEIVGPANFTTIEVEGPCEVPALVTISA